MLTAQGLDVCVAGSSWSTSSAKWGDANANGAVNVTDAQQLARYAVALSVTNLLAAEERGDVNADGLVDVLDALLVARFSAGLSAGARVNTAMTLASDLPAVASVEVSPTSLDLLVGVKQALVVTPRAANGTSLAGCSRLTYGSSRTAVATVSAAGLVTAKAIGTATMSVTAGGKAATVSVRVEGVLDIDGNLYETVVIGSQRWTARNLRVTRYRDETSLANTTDPVAWVASTMGEAVAINNNPVNDVPKGRLYNWRAITDARKLCPTGWRVPSDADWTTLVTYLGGADAAATKLKTTSGWSSSLNGTDEFGFHAGPTGHLDKDGGFYNLDGYTAYWSTTPYSSVPGEYWVRTIAPEVRTYVNRDYTWPVGGFSVRCIQE